MKIAISQPRYLPALIYLQRIYLCDTFVLLDDVQHSREFENRNYIKTPTGKMWLTIPCNGKSHRLKINELELSNMQWIEEHQNSIEHNYKKTPYFSKEILDFLYAFDTSNHSFSDTIHQYLLRCMELFEIKTPLITASSLNIESQKAQKLVDICRKLGATEYISGVNAQNYITNEFDTLPLYYHHYTHPTYPQLWGDFIPWMGFIDALFNTGVEQTTKMIKDIS